MTRRPRGRRDEYKKPPGRILAVMQASRQAVGSASARNVAATPAS
jgi:hypothetical protein